MISTQLNAELATRMDRIQTHNELAVRLNSALADDLPTFFRDGGVIRDGFDVGLDDMRALSHGGRTAVAATQAEYIAATGIHTLKIKFNNVLGYFIEVPSAKADDMMRPDSGFIHRQTMAGNVRFTTEKLIQLDNDIRSASDRAAAIEANVIESLIEEIR